MAGWQKIYRDIQEHWLWEDKPFSRGQAWIDLILSVNHDDNKALIDGELIEVKRGSKITSLRKLAEQWGWSATKVKKFLEQLGKDKMITYKSDSKKTLVTIENYGLYQDSDNTEKTPKFGNFKEKKSNLVFENDDANQKSLINYSEKETPQHTDITGVETSSNNTEITEKKQLKNTEKTLKEHRENTEKIQRKTNKNDKEYIKNDKEGKEVYKTQLPFFPTPIHEVIFNQFSEVTYKMWFERSLIETKGELIAITVAEDYKKKAIENGYLEAIKTLTGKNIIVKTKGGG